MLGAVIAGMSNYKIILSAGNFALRPCGNYHTLAVQGRATARPRVGLICHLQVVRRARQVSCFFTLFLPYVCSDKSSINHDLSHER